MKKNKNPVGEEHFPTEMSEIQQRVLGVVSVVEKKIFSLEEALKIYEVSKEKYEQLKNYKADVPEHLKNWSK
ncbi:MAG: hypothetical protein H0W75_04075 [Chitinophagaceae bacterium]|nr:hypothetical protein [Chitinophagaceae bacterium]